MNTLSEDRPIKPRRVSRRRKYTILVSLILVLVRLLPFSLFSPHSLQDTGANVYKNGYEQAKEDQDHRLPELISEAVFAIPLQGSFEVILGPEITVAFPFCLPSLPRPLSSGSATRKEHVEGARTWMGSSSP